ncbi:hypothetical protein K7472_30280 [Streptomyces sp. PTM05]|uniref:Uncharacterized protein n=1 Tax=Streptantibioticus parmotrematis TaxID=2873249 RepID=A0ABS7R0W0_9ACTN|nr:hypothetical protein [Streptantibioticus parmotrematis]MBY8889101.1 hypothetical protein [Streptantibioticus parmotrematis]
MNTNDPNGAAPLRDVAQNPDAYARYLADIQRVLLDVRGHLETLRDETRVHCRGVHVDGDRWYHARMRALPVEKSLNAVLRDLNSLTEGLEKSAYKRRAHDETVVNTGKARKEKRLENQRKKALKAGGAPHSVPQQGSVGQKSGYGGPRSIYDLEDRRESA